MACTDICLKAVVSPQRVSLIVGFQRQIQLSRLGGKANAIFSKRGLIHFGNHFNARSFSCPYFAHLLLLQKLVWSALVH